MVIQLVHVSIRPERRDRWLELVRAKAPRTRAENGCEGFRIGEDLETPNSFVLVERWASMEAQFGHFRTPEFRQLMDDLDDIVAGPPEVTIHEVATTLTLDEALAGAGMATD